MGGLYVPLCPIGGGGGGGCMSSTLCFVRLNAVLEPAKARDSAMLSASNTLQHENRFFCLHGSFRIRLEAK